MNATPVTLYRLIRRNQVTVSVRKLSPGRLQVEIHSARAHKGLDVTLLVEPQKVRPRMDEPSLSTCPFKEWRENFRTFHDQRNVVAMARNIIRTSNTRSSNKSGTHPSAPAPGCCTCGTTWRRAGSCRLRIRSRWSRLKPLLRARRCRRQS